PLRVQLDDVRFEELGAQEPAGPFRNGNPTQVDQPGIRDLELEGAARDRDRADMVDGHLALPRARGGARFDGLQMELPCQSRVEDGVGGPRVDTEPERPLAIDPKWNEDQLPFALALQGRDGLREGLRREDAPAK